MSQHNSNLSPKTSQPNSTFRPDPRPPGSTAFPLPGVTVSVRPADPGADAIEPHDLEAERSTLGALLIASELPSRIANLLKPPDFYIVRHRWIYAAICDLHARGEAIDLITVGGRLAEKQGTNGKTQLDDIGGPAYLTGLCDGPPNSTNVDTYARTVKDYSRRRDLKAAGEIIGGLAYSFDRDIADVQAGALEALQSRIVTDEKRRFILRDAAFALQPQPAIDYVVDGLVTAGSVNVLYGEAGSKKTYSALSLAVSVASGQPWLDFETKKCPVLFIDEESGERRFSRRLNAAIYGGLCQDGHIPLSFVSLAGFRLDEDTDPVILQALIQSTDARLVIIDALADVMSGDENDKADVQPVFNSLRKIAESTGAAIVLIHHAGKAGGYRGSSAIKGAVDLMVQIQSDNGSKFINFTSEKNRDGDKASWAAEAVWTDNQFYLQAAPRLVGDKPSASEAFVIGYLTKHGASLVDDIKDAADTCSPEAARRAIYRMAEEGKIARTNPDEKGKARYGLS